MLKPIKTLFKDNLILFSVAITIGILLLSLFRMPSTGINFAHIDKGYHSLAYFVLTLSWLFTFYKKPEKRYLVFFGCIVLGIVIEVLQHALTIYRTGDYLDVIANSIGALLALFVFNLFLKKRIN